MAQPIAIPVMGALPPPSGVTPNFVDPSQQIGVIIVPIISIITCTLFVGLRLFTRLTVGGLKSTRWDDCKLVH